MRHTPTYVTRMLDGLVSLSSIVGTLALIFIIIVTLVDVTGRLFGVPLSGAQDLSEMTMVVVVFGGMALCDKQGGNISVDIFEDKFSEKMNYCLNIIGWLIGCAIFSAIGYTMIGAAEMSRLLNLSSNILGLPKEPFQYAVAFFAFLTALAMFARVVTAFLNPWNHSLVSQGEEDL